MVTEGVHHVGMLAAEVEKFTRNGSEELLKGHLDKARECFDMAFKRSQQLGDSFTERACAFNLGAVYIAQRKPAKGLEMLQRAIPPLNQRDGKSNADLYYNFGLGYQLLNNDTHAVNYYELALEEYQYERENIKMEAEVAEKIANIYSTLDKYLPAARAFSVAAVAYANLQNVEKQALCLSWQASVLLKIHKVEEAIQAADDCMILCQRVSKSESLAKLYSDLGLLYTQSLDFAKAATCFELALPLNRSPAPGGDRRREAVILQNLGAVYNSLGDFQRSVPFHEQAATIHAELGSRNSQGQCFINLAFAHSQLGDNDAAGECYLHALQAARDTDDKHGQWQAMEGLGAVSFNNHKIDKAVQYFKSALATLAASAEANPLAQERIVAKLTDALQFQLEKGSSHDRKNIKEPSLPEEVVDMKVNDLKRPLSLEERKERERLSEAGRLLRQHVNVGSEFDHIARGLGTFETLSDNSAFTEREKRRFKRLYSRSMSRQSKDTVDRAQPYSDSEQRKGIVRKQSSRRRLPAGAAAPASVRRRQQTSLLRTDGHDSEEEYKHNRAERLKRKDTADMSVPQRVVHGFDKLRKRYASESQSELEYERRLEPPSTADASRSAHRRRRQQRRGDTRREQQKLIDMLKGMITDSKSPSGDESMSEGEVREEEAVISAQQVPTVHAKRPKSAKKKKTEENEEAKRPESGADLEDTSDMLPQQYAEKLAAMSDSGSAAEEEEEEEEEEDSEDEDEEDTDATQSGTDEEDQQRPPLPTSSPPRTATYETPVSDGNAGKPELQHRASSLNYGANFFREEADSQNVAARPVKVTVPEAGTGEFDDPVYQTIRTLQPGEAVPGTSASAGGSAPPPPPTRPLTQMTRGEQEEYLAKYHREYEANIQRRQEEVKLPNKQNNKAKSKACVIM